MMILTLFNSIQKISRRSILVVITLMNVEGKFYAGVANGVLSRVTLLRRRCSLNPGGRRLFYVWAQTIAT
jgi:hypothetical protein